LEPFSISLLTHWVVEKIGFPLFFVLFFFFTLARQMLYHLSPACMPFCSGYFGDRVSLFAQASLESCGEQIKAYDNWTQARQDPVNCFYL
jgi:hypothetical protein